MKNRLEELRKESGIKQEELASVLKVSRQTIGSLENGRYNPSILLAFRFLLFFSIPDFPEVFHKYFPVFSGCCHMYNYL